MIRRFFASPLVLLVYLFLWAWLLSLWVFLVIVLGGHGTTVWETYVDAMPSLTLARDEDGCLVAIISRIKD